MVCLSGAANRQDLLGRFYEAAVVEIAKPCAFRGKPLDVKIGQCGVGGLGRHAKRASTTF